MGEPEVNGDIRRDWGSLEASYGKALPDDYKWFVSAYGSGCVNDQLYFFHPRAVIGDQGLRIESLWEQAAYSYGEVDWTSGIVDAASVRAKRCLYGFRQAVAGVSGW